MATSRPNKSVINGLTCLQILAGRGCPVGCRELARETGEDPAVINRLLGTLEIMGMAEKTPERKYRPGPALHVLAAQSLRGSKLLPASLPLMDDFLRDGFAVSVGVLWKDQICFLVHARPQQKLISGIGTYDLKPAVESSAGIAILATRSKRMWPKKTRNSIALAKKHGYGELRFPNGEISLGMAVGHPAVAGLAISCRFKSDNKRLDAVERLRTVAETVTHLIGE